MLEDLLSLLGFTAVTRSITNQVHGLLSNFFPGNTITLRVAETVTFHEGVGQRTTKVIAESFTTSEAVTRGFSKAIAQAFTTTEATGRSLSKAFSEAWATSEALARSALKAFAENWNNLEALGKSMTKPFADGFTTTELSSRIVGKNFADGWLTTEALTLAFSKGIIEGFTAAEDVGHAFLRLFNEAFTTTDSVSKSFNKGIAESWTTAEALTRAIVFVRTFAEGFTTAEAIGKAMTIPIAEAFHTAEDYMRNANGVLSDMILQNKPMTLSDFINAVDSGHAPGYENFRDFVEGDYTYQDALFRILLQSVTSDRAALSALAVTVDVPDVFDSGEVTITSASAGFNVVYARSFYVVQPPQLSLKGGASTALTPEYSGVTTTGFNVKLRDSSGTLQTGTVSWSIRGY